MDNFKDLEELGINDDTDDQPEFQAAANHVEKKLAAGLDTAAILKLYGFYKQGLEGNCNVPKPSWYDFRAKLKWEAWNGLKDMPQQEAKQKYIDLVHELDSSFAGDGACKKSTTAKEGWVTVSTLQKPEENESESGDDDDLAASVKAADHNAVELLLSEAKSKYTKDFDWNRLDKDGMALIHWAADRGCTKMIKSLVQSGADVQAKDAEGQTAMHYAASCGHLECVELLLELGADAAVKDNDGADAFEAAADDAVRGLLAKCRLNVD